MCGFVYFHQTKLAKEQFDKALESIHHRGPDDTEFGEINGNLFGFKRLAIMDPTHAGDQPFKSSSAMVMCNGEIYNYPALKMEFSNYNYTSKSDCEVILPLYEKGGIELVTQKLDGEFAFVILDKKSGELFAGRDPMGIRPLFYGKTKTGQVAFASEAKALKETCSEIVPFPPGCYYAHGEIKTFNDLARDYKYVDHTIEEVTQNIHDLLVEGVKKRLQSDTPIGFLLSGGLDSSLVCSIAQKHSDKPIKTFGIGMSEDAIDLKYAKEVADYIGSDHTEVIITREDVLASLSDVIKHLESWDITTTRASVGMYLICKWIRENTDVKVLLTGEVSDEIFGYKYTDFAPSPSEFQKEAQKRVRELYIYDVLRADRCISAHSIEARVPFSDTEFVEYVMSIDPTLKMNTYGKGKYLLRKAFEHGDYLPESILYREKAAFSDAVGHSLVDTIKDYAESLYTESEFKMLIRKYPFKTPFTKESLLFREIFEGHYPNMSELICDYWMPNKEWENCDVTDPSARVLPNYGASGV